MTKTTQAKYSTAQEQAIRDAAARGPLNQAVAAELAASFGAGFSTRGVIAKISRMTDVAYERKAKVTKSGGKVESKEDIVGELQLLTSANLDGLDKAPKPALQALRDFLTA